MPLQLKFKHRRLGNTPTVRRHECANQPSGELRSAKYSRSGLERDFATPPLMPSSQLRNYLKTNRKRLALKQEEVAFMLGFKGEEKGIKVCRDENFTREPSLEMALAYEAIYGQPVRELFAGLYEEVEQ